VLVRRRSEMSNAWGRTARNVRDLARRVPIVITSLLSSAALLEVAAELAAARHSEQIVVATSTLPIAIKQQARKLLLAQGVTLLDCPLSGTGAQAKVKDLAVYAIGPRSAYRRCTPVFEGFARMHYFLGAFGAASRMKFLANLLVAIHNVSAAEALVLGMKTGLDSATMVKVLGDGAGSSRMLRVRGPMMVRNNYADAAMKVGVWQKDMQIIADFARARMPDAIVRHNNRHLQRCHGAGIYRGRRRVRLRGVGTLGSDASAFLRIVAGLDQSNQHINFRARIAIDPHQRVATF
jgi:putative dehydrogenase